ncbi:MAG: DUF484 family protein [Wenzhouxiangellaceae bacterium]
MNQTAEQTQIDPQHEQSIVEYLQQHPDFFARHSDLLQQLNTPEGTSGAASFSAYQLKQAQQRIDDLEAQLARLIAVAKDNEKVLSRLHRLTLAIAGCDSAADFLSRLEKELRDRFELDFFTLVIADDALPGLHNPRIRRPATDSSGLLNELLSQPYPASGRLTKAKIQALFGADSEVGSAAIAPIEGFGLLALGSHDVTRFAPDAGVLFLSLLGTTLQHHLQGPTLS